MLHAGDRVLETGDGVLQRHGVLDPVLGGRHQVLIDRGFRGHDTGHLGVVSTATIWLFLKIS